LKPYRLLIVLAALLTASQARLGAANAVLDWNEEAVDSTRLARNPPPLAALMYATFHVAVFDAVNGITRTHHGWLVDESAPAGADMDAAVAGAAFTVLNALWIQTNPRTFQIAYDKALAAIPDGQAKADGVAWGRKVAEAVLAKRAGCGFPSSFLSKSSFSMYRTGATTTS